MICVSLACALGLFRAGEPYLDRLSGEINIDNAPLAVMSQNLRRNHPDIKTYISPNYNLLATLKYQNPNLQIYTQKTMNLLRSHKGAADRVILLSLKHDPSLKAPHLNLRCDQKKSETIGGWTYFYEICDLKKN